VGNTSITIGLEARRHSVYNGSQKVVCTVDMVFVRIDGDGEAVPISDKVKTKYKI
jgi:acyl-CoA hydrolase